MAAAAKRPNSSKGHNQSNTCAPDSITLTDERRYRIVPHRHLLNYGTATTCPERVRVAFAEPVNGVQPALMCTVVPESA